MILPFTPHSVSYSVMIRIESPFPSEDSDVLRYDIDMVYFLKEGQTFVEVIKRDIQLNDEEVNDAFNDILIITAKAVERIIIKTDIKGKATGFGNMTEVLRKWKEAREEVEAQYQGEVVSQYLDDMEQNLVSPEITWKALSKSFFYTLMFNGLYGDYGVASAVTDRLELLDLLPEQKVVFPVSKTLFRNDEGGYTISLETLAKDFTLDERTIELYKAEYHQDEIPENALLKLEAYYSCNQTGKITDAQMTAEVKLAELFSKRMYIEVSEKL